MSTVLITYEYQPGELVYLITDEDQMPRMVLSFTYDGSTEIMYNLIKGTLSSTHYAKEITRERMYSK